MSLIFFALVLSIFINYNVASNNNSKIFPELNEVEDKILQNYLDIPDLKEMKKVNKHYAEESNKIINQRAFQWLYIFVVDAHEELNRRRIIQDDIIPVIDGRDLYTLFTNNDEQFEFYQVTITYTTLLNNSFSAAGINTYYDFSGCNQNNIIPVLFDISIEVDCIDNRKTIRYYEFVMSLDFSKNITSLRDSYWFELNGTEFSFSHDVNDDWIVWELSTTDRIDSYNEIVDNEIFTIEEIKFPVLIEVRYNFIINTSNEQNIEDLLQNSLCNPIIY